MYSSGSSLSCFHVQQIFQKNRLAEEYQLSVTLFDTEILVDSRLLVEERVSRKCGKYVHGEVEHASVPGMHLTSSLHTPEIFIKEFGNRFVSFHWYGFDVMCFVLGHIDADSCHSLSHVEHLIDTQAYVGYFEQPLLFLVDLQRHEANADVSLFCGA